MIEPEYPAHNRSPFFGRRAIRPELLSQSRGFDLRGGGADLPPSRMTRCNSDSRIIVRLPTLVRFNLPLLSQPWTVHLLIPPKRLAASSTESRSSRPVLLISKLNQLGHSIDKQEHVSILCQNQGHKSWHTQFTFRYHSISEPS